MLRETALLLSPMTVQLRSLRARVPEDSMIARRGRGRE